MRTTIARLSLGICLGALLGTPVFAQVETAQPQPSQQESAPSVPTLQDIRSPINLITNRPRAGSETGARTGAAQGAGQTGAAPGARTTFTGTDLQQRIQEFQFQQLQEDLQAQQAGELDATVGDTIRKAIRAR